MAVWGPRFAGMDALRGASLDEICARQWVACVEAASAALAAMEPGRAMTVHYEAMTEAPAATLRAILDFLGHAAPEDAIAAAVAAVSGRSVGKGRSALSGDAGGLMEILRPTLQRHGYEG